MSSEQQGKTAQKQHTSVASEGKTCVDCHFGIAHRKPGQGTEPGGVMASAPPAGAPGG